LFNEEQKEVIDWKDGPLLVLGTPGSGKTTVIINRIKTMIKQHGISPKKILVITFTRAAAESMKKRFLALMEDDDPDLGAVRFCTFHSFFYWVVRRAYHFENDAVLSEEEKYRIIRDILKEINTEYFYRNDLPESILNQLGVCSSNMLSLEDFDSVDVSACEFRTIASKYEETKRKLGKLDFQDMETMCFELLRTRPDIVEVLHKLYPYIMVDEFQDTNKMQYEILKMLVAPDNNLFAVGDDDQSIYSFRGARPDIMLNFSKDFSGAVVKGLTVNYRCPGIITNYSSMLIGNNKKRFLKALRSKKSMDEGDILYAEPKDTNTECRMIVKRIQESKNNGTEYDEMAVLYRTKREPGKLAAMLKKENIPFVITDTIPDIYSHFAVKTILDYIAYSLGNHSRELFLRIMNKPVRYIKRTWLTEEDVEISVLKDICIDEEAEYVLEYLDDLEDSVDTIRKMSPFASVNYIRKGVGYDEYLKGYAVEHHMDYSDLKEILDEFTAGLENLKTYDELYEQIDAERELLKEQEKIKKKGFSEGVRLMTLHSAKGLEFDEVHILNCVENIIPHKKALQDTDGLEEERRMFYVGMTRTKNILYLYAPVTIGGKKMTVSRFVREQLKK